MDISIYGFLDLKLPKKYTLRITAIELWDTVLAQTFSSTQKEERKNKCFTRWTHQSVDDNFVLF